MSNQAAQELQSFVRRVESVEDEINALNQDKSAIYKEAKSGGFNTKTLRKVVAARRMDATERQEQDAEFELYWNAVHGIDPDLVRAHVENIEEFDPETGEITEPQEAQAPAQAGHASPILDAQSGAGNVGNSLPGTESAADREPTTEPQSAPQAERDLAVPEPSGQVATHPEAKASEDGGATVQHIGSADNSVTGDASRASDGAGSVAPIQQETEAPYVPQPFTVDIAGSSNGRTAEFDSADAGSTPAPASTVTAFTPKPLRPHCLNPGNTCGGMGRKHCFKCQKAHDEQQGAA